jgi:hypothetical protein
MAEERIAAHNIKIQLLLNMNIILGGNYFPLGNHARRQAA